MNKNLVLAKVSEDTYNVSLRSKKSEDVLIEKLEEVLSNRKSLLSTAIVFDVLEIGFSFESSNKLIDIISSPNFIINKVIIRENWRPASIKDVVLVAKLLELVREKIYMGSVYDYVCNYSKVDLGLEIQKFINNKPKEKSSCILELKSDSLLESLPLANIVDFSRFSVTAFDIADFTFWGIFNGNADYSKYVDSADLVTEKTAISHFVSTKFRFSLQSVLKLNTLYKNSGHDKEALKNNIEFIAGLICKNQETVLENPKFKIQYPGARVMDIKVSGLVIDVVFKKVYDDEGRVVVVVKDIQNL